MIDLDESITREELVNDIIETIENIEEYNEFDDDEELLKFEDIFRSAENSIVSDLSELWEEFEARFRTCDDMDDDEVLVAYLNALENEYLPLVEAEEKALAEIEAGIAKFVEA